MLEADWRQGRPVVFGRIVSRELGAGLPPHHEVPFSLDYNSPVTVVSTADVQLRPIPPDDAEEISGVPGVLRGALRPCWLSFREADGGYSGVEVQLLFADLEPDQSRLGRDILGQALVAIDPPDLLLIELKSPHLRVPPTSV